MRCDICGARTTSAAYIVRALHSASASHGPPEAGRAMRYAAYDATLIRPRTHTRTSANTHSTGARTPTHPRTHSHTNTVGRVAVAVGVGGRAAREDVEAAPHLFQ